MSQPSLHTDVTDLSPETGLKDKTRDAMAKELTNAVSDAYRLMINTQGLHWNVQGPLFYSLHKLTEEQYEDLFEAIDDLAERIRAIGLPAPATVGELVEHAQVDDPPVDGDLHAKVASLVEANEQIALRLRNGVRAAEKLDDVKTADLLTDRIGVHETNAWMLRATIAS